MCGRQYDVTHIESQRMVRCECGHRFRVVRKEAHTPRALKCSNCGGNLSVGSTRCGYCSAEITLEELRLSSVCPACFARMGDDARFCMECGVEIAPQALFAIADGVVCPRCKGDLRGRLLGHTSITECARCGGMWLDAEAFTRLCDRKEAESIPPGVLSLGPLPGEARGSSLGSSARVVTGYIPCVACAQLMTRKNFASSSGVIIDVCRAHGVWLDAHELERILTFIRDGGMDRARAKQIEQLREQERRTRAARASQVDIDLSDRRAANWRSSPSTTPFAVLLDVLLEGLF